MRSITIEKTGNFWIDNGIVSLYEVLENLDEEEYSFDKLELLSDKLIVELAEAEEDELPQVLNRAKELAVQDYLTETDNAGWIYREGAFEVYRRKDFRMHLKPFFTGKTPVTQGALVVPTAKESDAGGKGRKMTDEEYQAFVAFKEENAETRINGKKIKLDNKGFLNAPPQYEIGDAFLPDFEEAGKKQCLFSGRKYKKTATITGMDYPFLTGASGELNFSSQLDKKPEISALYSFVAVFAFRNLFYLQQGDEKHYFVLYDSDLNKLDSFSKTISNTKALEGHVFSNFDLAITGTQYASECFMNFLMSVYKQVKDKINLGRLTETLFTKRVFTLYNDGNIFKIVREYSSLTELFDLFNKLAGSGENEANYYNFLVNMIRYFSQRLPGGKYDTTWRNRLCSDILTLNSINKTLEWFLGEVKLKEESGTFVYLDKIIEIYNEKINKNMNAEKVKLCKTVGNYIGACCREKEDKGILFSIRNAKNRREFLNVLAEIQFRIKVSYSEDFFEAIPDDEDWEEYKALVSVFAMNSFMFKDKKTNN